MNALPPDLPPDGGEPDGIDSGKRLVRIAGDRGLSLAERLAEQIGRAHV